MPKAACPSRHNNRTLKSPVVDERRAAVSPNPDRLAELRETAQITEAIRKGLERRWSHTVRDARLVGFILGALDEAGYRIVVKNC